MTAIIDVKARQVLNSRGEPTVEVDVELEDGSYGRAIVPSGASKGRYEAAEIRDSDASAYLGKGVTAVVNTVNTEIFDCICGMDATEQVAIDMAMISLDGTHDKSRLGANAILGVSLAVAKAAAHSLGLPLFCYLGGPNAKVMPVPMINLINGGAHANNAIDFQEFMIVPTGSSSFSDALRMGAEIFYALKEDLVFTGRSISVGEEGGFTIDLSSAEEALDLILNAVKRAGYIPETDVCLALDCAASRLYKDEHYIYLGEGVRRNSEEQVEYLCKLTERYPIASIEDGMSEDDLPGWELLTQKLGKTVQLVGDDLFVTSMSRFKSAFANGIANSILVKPNQVGSLTETLDVVQLAHRSSYTAILSHRSGDTEDVTVADLAVATNCGLIKVGSVARSERTAKYNQLLRIEEMLGSAAVYVGDFFLKR